MFGIFRSRTSAYYFSQDLKHGGAAYIPTGRGYALKHATFVKTYTSYGRSHIYYAVTVRCSSAQYYNQCRLLFHDALQAAGYTVHAGPLDY